MCVKVCLCVHVTEGGEQDGRKGGEEGAGCDFLLANWCWLVVLSHCRLALITNYKVPVFTLGVFNKRCLITLQNT